MTFPNDIAERDKYILQQIEMGNFEHLWHPITSTYNGHTATFFVSSDALKIENTRINCSAYLQQQIADRLGAMLLTAKLADLLHAQAEIVVEPVTRPITSSTQGMIDQSTAIDNQIAKLYPGVDVSEMLISCVCKHWLIDTMLKSNSNMACNYGFFTNTNPWKGIPTYPCASQIKNPKTGMFYYVINSRMLAHNYLHVDYSQDCVLVMIYCEVDGVATTLHDVLMNPDLAPLASHNGVIKIFRQPGVPEPTESIVIDKESRII